MLEVEKFINLKKIKMLIEDTNTGAALACKGAYGISLLRGAEWDGGVGRVDVTGPWNPNLSLLAPRTNQPL